MDLHDAPAAGDAQHPAEAAVAKAAGRHRRAQGAQDAGGGEALGEAVAEKANPGGADQRAGGGRPVLLQGVGGRGAGPGAAALKAGDVARLAMDLQLVVEVAHPADRGDAAEHVVDLVLQDRAAQGDPARLDADLQGAGVGDDAAQFGADPLLQVDDPGCWMGDLVRRSQQRLVRAGRRAKRTPPASPCRWAV